MRLIKFIGFVLLAFCCIGNCKTSQIKNSDKVSEKYFLTDFPEIVCLEDDYFLKCYDIKKTDCVSQVKKFSADCLKNLINKNLTKERKLIQIGSCIGEKYDSKNQHLRLTDNKCFESKGW